jgi:hypothetical protein
MQRTLTARDVGREERRTDPAQLALSGRCSTALLARSEIASGSTGQHESIRVGKVICHVLP